MIKISSKFLIYIVMSTITLKSIKLKFNLYMKKKNDKIALWSDLNQIA
jgi:hypothetical protein